ncbi:MAG: regulatory protein RecX [Colwellia sp.]|nr:regulatory protein RecX [Colwellia sp.]
MDKKILHIAVDLLSRREHSSKEIYQKLALRGYEQIDVAPVIDYLLEKNYLSHERFAESVFRNRVSRGYGWRYIKNELNQKGIDSIQISELNNNQEIDWYIQVELAYNKRFDSSADLDQKDKAKRVRFLQYRGFSTDEIMSLF